VIVVDTSAFVCIATAEPGFERFAHALRVASGRKLSAGTYLECAMLAETRLGGRGATEAWMRREDIDVVAVDHALAQVAADAFARFGKGRHPAGLTYGDCFSYALARSLRAPLLYKGDDFARTDITSALAA
jgi:ribonuclease VapC